MREVYKMYMFKENEFVGDEISFDDEGSAVSGIFDVVNLYNNQFTKVCVIRDI